MHARQVTRQESDGWREVTIPIREIVSRLGWWLLVTAVLIYGLMGVLWGPPNLPGWPPPARWLGDLAQGAGLLLVAYVLSVPLHEGLHALGMILTGSRKSDISFGARLFHGIVYVHCGAPMKLSAYRMVLILPVAATGIAPAVWGLAVGSGWIATYAYLMIVSAIGDLEMFWRLRHWPGTVLIRDHPSLLGCELRELPAGGA